MKPPSPLTSFSAPQFITFTGADDRTLHVDLKALAQAFPVEFGVLFSPKLRGSPRYPAAKWVDALLRRIDSPLSAHICGEYSRELLATGTIRELLPVLSTGQFQRVQINTADPRLFGRIGQITAWGESLGLQVILQSRDAKLFPAPGKAQWLFDASGGNGRFPESWPTEPTDRLVGYAGGLQPDNVGEAVKNIGTKALNYWLDMETGVRDKADHFSIDACYQVCEQVFPNPPVQGSTASPQRAPRNS